MICSCLPPHVAVLPRPSPSAVSRPASLSPPLQPVHTAGSGAAGSGGVARAGTIRMRPGTMLMRGACFSVIIRWIIQSILRPPKKGEDSMPHARFSVHETVERGKELYEREIRPHVE